MFHRLVLDNVVRLGKGLEIPCLFHFLVVEFFTDTVIVEIVLLRFIIVEVLFFSMNAGSSGIPLTVDLLVLDLLLVEVWVMVLRKIPHNLHIFKSIKRDGLMRFIMITSAKNDML